MNHEDTLLGVAVSNNQTERTYTKYTIEYDLDKPMAEFLTIEETIEQNDGTESTVETTLAESDTTLSEYVDGAPIQDKVGAETTYTDADGTEQAYTRRVLVADETTRDIIEGELSTADVPYETRDVAPTPKQRYLIEREGARNADEVMEAIEAKGTLLDRALVTDETKVPIATAISGMQDSDPELAEALDNVFEVMTGETVAELLERVETQTETNA